MRAIPAACMGLLQTFEGFRAARYLDTGGRPTIGYGHLLSGPADPLWDETLTEPQAEDLANQDLARVAAQPLCVDLGDDLVAALSDGQYAALIDFTYNEGYGRWRGSSLRTAVLARAFTAVPMHLEQWVYGQENGQEVQLADLIRRRAAEVALWNS